MSAEGGETVQVKVKIKENIKSTISQMEPTQTCEALAHEDKKAATVKKQAASKAAAGNSLTLVTMIVKVLIYAGKATFNFTP